MDIPHRQFVVGSRPTAAHRKEAREQVAAQYVNFSQWSIADKVVGWNVVNAVNLVQKQNSTRIELALRKPAH